MVAFIDVNDRSEVAIREFVDREGGGQQAFRVVRESGVEYSDIDYWGAS